MIGVATSTQNGIVRHVRGARRWAHVSLCGIALCAAGPACKRTLSKDDRPRLGDALASGSGVDLLGARGETLRLHGELFVYGLEVQRAVAEPVVVRRGSSSMYGAGGRGPGRYLDVLRPVPAGGSRDLHSTLAIPRDARPGEYTGTLRRDGRELAVTLTISEVTLPERAVPRVWAYYDPRELVWAGLGTGTVAAPSDEERACIAMFRDHGVLLSPDLPVSAYAARRELLAGFPFVPALIANGDDVRAWIAATAGTAQVPFAIPIDEPNDAEARARVKALSTEARAAGAGPGRFLYAVTSEPHAELGDAIDLYITLTAKRGDAFARWTYNGAPPRAGSMVVDALPPGPRTWGWIAHRWSIPVWYVWDALYWHDRHNRRGAPLPGKPLDITADATSFANDEDHGNLDGVLALPGDPATPCLPTLRLAAIDRGMQDRALIELASACDAAATEHLVETIVPRALGDAPRDSAPAWPTDEASWERARRELISIAARCVR